VRRLALLLALCAAGCRCGARDSVETSAPGSAAPAPSAKRELPPLAAESWRIELDVPGFEPSSLAVPLGAREPRPVVIALHGIADLAEWQCGTWTGISGGRAFVLCPRGIRRGGSETWGDAPRTEQELRAALGALKKRFGEHVAPGPVVLAGYSLGAAHAARLLKQEPSFFSRVVLVEGGLEPLTSTAAAVFARGGGQRVLFACGQRACESEARRRLVYLRRAGTDAELVTALEVGHALDGRMAKAIAQRWAWLTAGDPRFAPGTQ
jgi:predicted esterase